MATPFHQSHLTRAVAAARRAGLPILRTIVHPDGAVEIIHADTDSKSDTVAPLDKWLEETACTSE